MLISGFSNLNPVEVGALLLAATGLITVWLEAGFKS
jgi:hypothetical protein